MKIPKIKNNPIVMARLLLPVTIRLAKRMSKTAIAHGFIESTKAAQVITPAESAERFAKLAG